MAGAPAVTTEAIDDGADQWSHHRADVGEVSLHYVAAGPTDGDLVVCLHGFPECWYTWRHQLPALVDAGFRVVAPDLRGANQSDKPSGVGAYHLDHLVGDVVGLLDALDRDVANVLAHDFGGLVAWQLAHERPELVDRLAVLNCPNLSVYDRHLRSSLAQVRKSWYVFFFQLPRVPEWGFRYDDYTAIEDAFREHAAPGAVSDADVERFKAAFSRDGTATAMLNWYRAIFRWYVGRIVRRRGPIEMPIGVPTLLCWGEQDHALSADLIDDHHDWVEDLRIERFPDASHWVQFDEREDVNVTLRAFL